MLWLNVHTTDCCFHDCDQLQISLYAWLCLGLLNFVLVFTNTRRTLCRPTDFVALHMLVALTQCSIIRCKTAKSLV